MIGLPRGAPVLTTSGHMLEGVEKARATVDVQQQLRDVDALDGIEQRLVLDGVRLVANLSPHEPPVPELSERVLAAADAPVHLLEARVERSTQLPEAALDRRARRHHPELGQQHVPARERRLVDQIVLDAAEPHALAAEHITALERVAQGPVDQELVPIAPDRSARIEQMPPVTIGDDR